MTYDSVHDTKHLISKSPGGKRKGNYFHVGFRLQSSRKSMVRTIHPVIHKTL